MLFWKGSKLGQNECLELKNEVNKKACCIETGYQLNSIFIGKHYYFLIVALFGILLLVCSWLSPLCVLLWCVFVYFIVKYWQLMAKLSSSQSITCLFCKQGIWCLQTREGLFIESLVLDHYFLSTHYLVLHFRLNEPVLNLTKVNLSALSFWQHKKIHLMIFPSQLGEKNFRSLFCALKLHDKRLFVDSI
jgi:hypothetical protein